MGALFGFDCQIIMKLLILLSFLAFSAYADPVENGMYQWFNYLKSQPVLLQEERRQAEDLDRSGQQNFTYFVRADGTREDCNCDADGSLDATCDAETGQCPCKSDLITGEKCDHSTPGYFNFPDPEPCACNAEGSDGETCDDGSGKCSCNANIVGDKCTQCAAEHFDFPTCEACMCLAEGSVDNSCG